jgi:excisionase family DNA binding protein
MEGRRLLSAEEVAAKIRMEVPYVWKLAREGRIPHLRFGRTLRFREESIAAWLEERERGNGPGDQSRRIRPGMSCQTARTLVRQQGRALMGFLQRFTATFVAATALTVPASASALELQPVGSFQSPTYVTSDPQDPNRIFVVEQAGRVQLVEAGNTTTFLDITSIVRYPPDPGAFDGADALASMAFSPNYATNHLFYVAYTGVDDPGTVEDESGDWHLDEFRANGDTADPASRRGVLTIDYPSNSAHYGGQLQFGPDGYLYASTGDGLDSPGEPAQDLATRLGKILRIDPKGSASGEYTVPTDNPFATTAGCTDGCDEIWSYGLRNPWRFSFDRLTGDLVIGDVGYLDWEEVDFETGPNAGRGDNFGWYCREGAHSGPGETSPVCAERAGTFTAPVFEYPHTDPTPADPTDNAFGCSIIGGYVVRDLALADLYGRYLYSDFCAGLPSSVGELRSLIPGLPTASGDRSEGLSVPFVTSFGEDADCRIYVASWNGPVYRLMEPIGGAGGCPPSPSPPSAGALSLDLKAKKQPLRKKLKFFATATADSTLVARGKAIKETAKELASNQKTKVKVKLNRAKRKQLQKRVDEKGNAKVTVKATATDQSGATATDQIKLKLR